MGGLIYWSMSKHGNTAYKVKILIQVLIWPTFFFNTAWTLLAKLSCKVFKLSSGIVLATFLLSMFRCKMPFFSFTVKMIPRCFYIVEVYWLHVWDHFHAEKWWYYMVDQNLTWCYFSAFIVPSVLRICLTSLTGAMTEPPPCYTWWWTSWAFPKSVHTIKNFHTL